MKRVLLRLSPGIVIRMGVRKLRITGLKLRSVRLEFGGGGKTARFDLTIGRNMTGEVVIKTIQILMYVVFLLKLLRCLLCFNRLDIVHLLAVACRSCGDFG